jgi:hypothetical protein
MAQLAEDAHQLRQVPERHVGGHHHVLRAAFVVEASGGQCMADRELLRGGREKGRGPCRALGLQGVHEPGALRGVVVAAVGGDVRRGKALLRVAAFGVGRAFVLPGLGAEFGAAQHLAQGRCRIAHGRDQVAVVGGHVEAVELGGLLQQRPEHLGGLLAVFAGRMQAGRIADGANHRVGLGEECEHVVFHAVVVDLVRGRAHLRHHALDGPVAQCHQQQRLHQRDGADDGADVDTKAAHAGACEIVCHTDPAAPLRRCVARALVLVLPSGDSACTWAGAGRRERVCTPLKWHAGRRGFTAADKLRPAPRFSTAHLLGVLGCLRSG